MANAVLSVGRAEEGRASGILNTIRQVGGVLDVAVPAAVSSAIGSCASPESSWTGPPRRRCGSALLWSS